MSLLNDDFYTNLVKQRVQNTPLPAQQPQQPAAVAVQEKPKTFQEASDQTLDTIAKGLTDLPPEQGGQIGTISEAEQIKRFGGPVGSDAYYKYISEHPVKSFLGRSIGEGFGLRMPGNEQWDKFSASEKIAYTGVAAESTVLNLLAGLPKAVIKVIPTLSITAAQGIKGALSGQGPQDLAREPVTKLPYFGDTPTWFQTAHEARKAGYGPWQTALLTGTKAVGDLTVGALYKDFVTSFQPRVRLNGRPVIDAKEVGAAMERDQTGVVISQKAVAEGVGEYKTMSREMARKYGGTTENMRWKVTPAGVNGESAELSVVRLGKGKDATDGKMGPETKVSAGTIMVEKTVAQPFESNGTTYFRGVPPKGTPLNYAQIGKGKYISSDEAVANFYAKGGGKVEQYEIAKDVKLIDAESNEFKQLYKELAEDPNRDLTTGLTEELTKRGYDGVNGTIQSEAQNAPKRNQVVIFNESKIRLKVAPKTESDRLLALSSIIKKPLKGQENKLITEKETTHLATLAEANGIDGNMANAVVRVVTGKDAVGNLTHAEYVKASQTLGAFRNAALNEQRVGGVFINAFTQYLSPQRRWMRAIEEKHGIPIYSKVYVPIENAAKLRDIFRSDYRNQIREIFGNYTGSKWGEERRLIKAYMEGNKGVITENAALSAEVKSDLIAISENLANLYDELGITFGIPREVFLKDYQPHIQDLGGVYMLYKDAAEIPQSLTAFFEFKRTGALTTQVDDALALADIYVNAGSNKLFFNPALEEVAKVSGGLNPSLAGSVKSYVGEKLGRASAFERAVNETIPRIWKNIPFANRWDIPGDLGRRFTSYMMDTTYAGALGGRPDAVIRNLLQNPLLAFPRLGGKFYVEAVRKAITKEGIAEVRKNGFLVEQGIPYGEEVARQSIGVPGRIGNLYQGGTQALLKPYGAADTFTRGATYWQSRYIWEDAMARYSSGKLTWEQFEKAIDMNAVHVVDRNIIRDMVIKGDADGAMNHFIRDIIDETQFPYRRGASSRITYGLGGKLGTQFAQWNIEFIHTIGGWVKTKQWDKLVRFAGTAEATRRTLQDSFGIDVSKWVGIGAVGTTPSPFVQFGGELLDLVNNVRNNNAPLVNESKDAIIRTMTALGVPAGVQIQRFRDFMRSVNFSERYKLPEGQFGVYSKTGGLLYTTDFNGIFWKMWGFPPQEGTEALDRSRRETNAMTERTDAKRQGLQFLQEGKFDEANEILSKYQIQVTNEDFKKWYIPIDQRNFYRLPPYLKQQFYNSVFNK